MELIIDLSHSEFIITNHYLLVRNKHNVSERLLRTYFF